MLHQFPPMPRSTDYGGGGGGQHFNGMEGKGGWLVLTPTSKSNIIALYCLSLDDKVKEG
jgi:hypothetical protein